MARLIYSDNQGRKAIPLGLSNRIGRHPNSTIQLLDGIVSKEHCMIEARGALMTIRDVGSSNGTFVNSEKLAAERVLRHGDEIRLGNTTLIFDDEVNQAPVATPPISQGAVHHAAPVATAVAGATPWRQATTPIPQQPLVNLQQSMYAIGSQVAAQSKDFQPFEQAVMDPTALRLDYERLRITWELLREIGLERDLDKLLAKILTALFRFVAADRGVILIKEADGSLTPRAHRRKDGAQVAINISSTILNHVIKERAGVLSHDASSERAPTSACRRASRCSSTRSRARSSCPFSTRRT
jgi:adenylate cyclase